MAMIIAHNMSALNTLSAFSRSQKAASKAAGQLSSGERINSAGDSAAEYSITEKMDANLLALRQCDENTQTGHSMLQVATEAIDNQVNILQKVTTIALKASDDTYTDVDRATLQKEISQLLDQCEDIAQQTTYNGRYLLNQRKISKITDWFDPTIPYRPNPNNRPVIAQAATQDYPVPVGDYVPVSNPPTNIYDINTMVQGSPYSSLPTAGAFVWDDAAGQAVQVTSDASGTLYAGSTIIQVSGQSNPPGSPAAASTNIG